MAKRSSILCCMICCFCAFTAYGDDFSRFELFGAYSMTRTSIPLVDVYAARLSGADMFILSFSGNHRELSKGFKTGVTFNLHRHVGFVGEFGWNRTPNAYKPQLSPFYSANQPFCDIGPTCLVDQNLKMDSGNHSQSAFTLLLGPHFSLKFHNRFKPFAHILVGFQRIVANENQQFELIQEWNSSNNNSSHVNQYTSTIKISPDTSFAAALGGGLDIKIQKHFSVRLFEVEVLNSRHAPKRYVADSRLKTDGLQTGSYSNVLEGHDLRTNSLKLSFGMVFHIDPRTGS
jgi:hypothetical protein